MSMFFTIETNFLAKEGIFIRIHRALLAAENFSFYALGLHRVPHHTGLTCAPTWSVTVSQLLLWVGCRSPAFSHITWSQKKPHTKTRRQNSTNHCISVTKRYQSKRETLLGWTTKCYIQQLYAWKGNSTVLRAQRRWDSSKWDSNQEAQWQEWQQQGGDANSASLGGCWWGISMAAKAAGKDSDGKGYLEHRRTEQVLQLPQHSLLCASTWDKS